MNKRILAAVFFSIMTLALAGHGDAAEKSPGAAVTENKKAAETGRFGIINYRITFKMSADILESSGTVVALDRADADYYTRGDTAVHTGESEGKPQYSLKNFGSKASFRASTDPRDGNYVNLESQFELLGPLMPKGSGRQMITIGLQTVTRVMLGKTTVIANTPDSRIEVTVEAVK